jgi:hypothetical protein
LPGARRRACSTGTASAPRPSDRRRVRHAPLHPRLALPEPHVPTVDEVRAFVADYEKPAGRPFSEPSGSPPAPRTSSAPPTAPAASTCWPRAASRTDRLSRPVGSSGCRAARLGSPAGLDQERGTAVALGRAQGPNDGHAEGGDRAGPRAGVRRRPHGRRPRLPRGRRTGAADRSRS